MRYSAIESVSCFESNEHPELQMEHHSIIQHEPKPYVNVMMANGWLHCGLTHLAHFGTILTPCFLLFHGRLCFVMFP